MLASGMGELLNAILFYSTSRFFCKSPNCRGFVVINGTCASKPITTTKTNCNKGDHTNSEICEFLYWDQRKSWTFVQKIKTRDERERGRGERTSRAASLEKCYNAHKPLIAWIASKYRMQM